MREVLLTVDTEGVRGTDPVKYQIWGDVNGKMYGIPQIIDLCNKYSIKALFFVDVAEVYDYGYEKIAEVIKFIKSHGHYVGVHIHPHHMPGEDRHFLFDYTKEEQRKILTDCTNLYIQITGEQPLSFRAGKFGANRDTLEILQELGYKYDFSEFYSQKWCGIKPEVAYVLPQYVDNIIEFPITVFNSLRIGKMYSRYDCMEVVDSYKEIVNALDAYAKNNIDGVVVLIMHSFSFLNWLDTPDKPKLNRHNIKVFEKVLKYIYHSNVLKNVSEAELVKHKPVEVDKVDNIIETEGIHRQIWYSYLRVLRIRKTSAKAKVLLCINLIVVLVIVVVILFLLFR